MNRSTRILDPDKVRAKLPGALWIARAYEDETLTWAEAIRQMTRLGIGKAEAERYLSCLNER